MNDTKTAAALNKTLEAHARALAAMDDEELLQLQPSSPLEYELMFRLGIMQEMYESADERALEYRHELEVREWVDRQAMQ